MPDDNNCRNARSQCYEALSGIWWKRGGVYFLYAGEELLYIGRSINVKQRTLDHLMGSGGAIPKQLAGSITYVRGFYAYDVNDQEIYESYAIKTLKPKLNKAKTNQIRGNYRATVTM
ncbi:GIY-YIG nuclease family protein [Paenibacillus alvei]|uniref:GIY-YIG nuclease family protein n=1 Tax=Paenibacillus alvei TaxID=44250 RepID=UPI003990B725